MTGRFTGKVALVTGGGSGLGRGTALAFAREGATVVAVGRRDEPLAETVGLIEAEGGTASHITADVADEADVERMVATAVERHGALDIAHNNAGIFGPSGPVADNDAAEWRSVIDANLVGVFLCMKYEIAHMREHGGGDIVNTSSTLGPHTRYPHYSAYSAAKAGMATLTRVAALDHVADKVRINIVSPGTIAGPLSKLPGETDEERDARYAPLVPLGRIGQVDDVAAAVLWLCSPESGFVVGHDLVIDGGLTA
ncbi:SDR family NAD(P)-dependent oxidoreductase [Nocardiopsis sediminis]|uniref:SDR family NAD(P)-dependent oxidoreductase n=1 Tax=Nocardiopsis sediminis TaxID=1778267 RepID=A0ABV8FL44_9ACTN